MIAPPFDRSNPRDDGEERLGGDGHVVGVGMEQGVAVAHDPDVTLPEDEIAAAKRVLGAEVLAEEGGLHVGVARRGDAGGEERQLHEAGAVDAAGAAAAPEIGDAEEALGLRHEVGRDGGEVRRRNEAAAAKLGEAATGAADGDVGEEGQVVLDLAP